MSNNFLSNFKKGSEAEDFISDYLEELYSWTFVAGAKHGKVINTKYIENVFHCTYLETGWYKKGYFGPRLEFENGDIAIMPDLLFLSSHKDHFWVESKASFNPDYNTLDIECEKLKSYIIIQKHCTKTVWLILSLVDEENNACKLYSTNIDKLNKYVNQYHLKEETSNYKQPVYSFDITSNIFRELTKGVLKYR